MTRLTGVIENVYESQVTVILAADATAGDSTITVDDTEPLDPIGGGSVKIGSQLDAYTAVDETTGVVTLVDPLSADAFEGDVVTVWDTAMGAAAVEVRALVALPGAHANDDSIDAAIRHSLVPLVDSGLREPGQGESVIMVDESDEWWIIDVIGKRPKIQPPYQPVVPGVKYMNLSITDDSLTAGSGAQMSIPLLVGAQINDGFASEQSVTARPAIVAAAGTVAAVGYNSAVPVTLSACTLSVTNTAGTQRLVVNATSSINLTHLFFAGVLDSSTFSQWVVDATQTIGSDLSLDASTGRVHSAAGGVFTASLYAAVHKID